MAKVSLPKATRRPNIWISNVSSSTLRTHKLVLVVEVRLWQGSCDRQHAMQVELRTINRQCTRTWIRSFALIQRLSVPRSQQQSILAVPITTSSTSKGKVRRQRHLVYSIRFKSLRPKVKRIRVTADKCHFSTRHITLADTHIWEDLRHPISTHSTLRTSRKTSMPSIRNRV